MRQRDYVPLVLLAGIAGFIVVQGTRDRHDAPRAPAAHATAASTTPDSPRVAPRTEPAPPRSAPPPTADSQVSALAPARQAGTPTAPARDLAALQQKIADGAPGTYLLAMLAEDSVITRWPERRVNALRVFIERYSTLPDFQPTYPVVAEHAFDEWHEAGFPLRFDIVSDSTQADISIRWVMTVEGGEGRIGSTTKTRDAEGWITAAEILVSTHDRDTGAPLDPSLIAGIARHEIGHALGLGHSDNPADVMYPESRTTVISRADRATLHLLYILPPGPTR